MTPKAPSAYTVNVAFTSMLGGMDNRMHPSLIKDGSYVRAVNMVVNNGFLATRSSFAKVAEIPLSLAEPYRGSQVRQYGSTSEICLLVGNKFWVVDLFTGGKADRTGSANLAGTEIVTSAQAERYVVIVGQSMGFYWDGSTLTMLDGTQNQANEVLRFGTSLHYTCGRLFYIPETIDNSSHTGWYDNNKQSLLAGDLFSTGTPANIFKFTEWHDAAGGGAIGMPASLGSMVALASKPDQTGTGTSGLLVFCTNGIISYAVGKPRTNSVDAGNQWYPVAVVVQPLSQASIVGSFGTVVANGVTALAPLGWTVSNADVLFLAAGGIYSLNSIFRSSSWNSMNVEAMSLALGTWNRLFDAGTSMAANQTRVFATANSSGGIYKAIMTTNTLFTTTDQFGKQSALWEGAFTGLPTRKIEVAVLDNQRKLVMTVERKDTMLEVWTQTEGDLTEAVESRVYFKQIDVNNQTRMNFVELDGELLTDCNFSVYVRPYGCYLWYQLGSTKTLANTAEHHAFSNVRFTLNESPYRTKSGANWNSQTWDVCVLIKGHCTLRRAEVDCSPAPTVYNAGMGESELEGGVDLDATDFDYEYNVDPLVQIDPITNLAASSGSNYVDLTWTNPSDVRFAGVEIRRAVGSYPSISSGAVVYTGNGTAFRDTGLTNGALYYYSAFAFTADGKYSVAARISSNPVDLVITGYDTYKDFGGKRYLTFNYSRDLVVANKAVLVDIYVLGGGGGMSFNSTAGGGGGYCVGLGVELPVGTHSVVVDTGGAFGHAGGASSFAGVIGGGGGIGDSTAGSSGAPTVHGNGYVPGVDKPGGGGAGGPGVGATGGVGVAFPAELGERGGGGAGQGGTASGGGGTAATEPTTNYGGGAGYGNTVTGRGGAGVVIICCQQFTIPVTPAVVIADPTDFTATGGVHKVYLAWVNMTGASFLRTKIWRNTSAGGGPTVTTVYSGTGTSVSDSLAPVGSVSYYTAITISSMPPTYNSVGVSASATAQSAPTQNPVTNLTMTQGPSMPGYKTITPSWTNPTDAYFDHVFIDQAYSDTTPTSWSLWDLATSNTGAAALVPIGSKWWVRLRAVNHFGDASASTIESATATT